MERVKQAIEIANTNYEGNLKLGGPNSGRKWDASGNPQFTLGVHDSKGRGARRSQDGRRIAAACWHAHRDTLRALFLLEPTAIVKTAMATYKGLSGFEETFPDTYHKNSGSIMNPVEYGSLCECQWGEAWE
jgi:hypothetical protein